MKPLRVLGVIALMAAALFLLSASSASATALCTNSSCTTVYPSGTAIHATLKSGTSALLEKTNGEKIATCTGSTVKGSIGTATGTWVTGNITELTWSGCSQTTTTINNGSLEIMQSTVVGKGSNVTLSVFGVTCTYGTGEGTTLGSLIGGEEPTLAINAVVLRSAGNTILCPSSGRWTAEYVITEPHTVFMEGEGGGATSTSLTTSLSGEAKSGEEITVNEGSKVKDTATLSGTNASKATGTVKYKVYSDKECKELVTSAGEVTVTSGSVPASEEKTLEAGRVYYWQAEYGGDTNNLSSKSTCGKEVLTVKAATSISTSLSGESKSGEEITVNEGSKVKDQATLSGTKSSSATGKVKFKAYKDKECKELASEAGEGSLSEGKATSEEKTLEAGALYYWQAEYPGDSLHQASTSTCSKEVLTVKAATSISTSLSGEGKEGEAITVNEGAKVKDQATLSGTKSSTATGTLKYKVYSDSECKELVTSAGEVSLSEGKAPASEEKTLSAGAVYYWQASYEGDSLHQKSTSTCTEKATIKAATSISTSLSGEEKSGEEITILEGSKAKDTATLSGTKSSTATGKVKFKAYKDKECKELASEAGEGSLSEGKATSEEKTLEAGALYYWQAEYPGDSLHQASTSACGKEVLTVKALTSLSTKLFGASGEGKEISAPAGSTVIDTTVLGGTASTIATGEVIYRVYADPECKELVAEAGEATVIAGVVPPSEKEELKAGSYYWQVSYGGDSLHEATTSGCDEVATVTASTSLTTSLSGEGKEGEPAPEEEAEAENVLTVTEGADVTDAATLSGENAATATGTVKYAVYSDPNCENLVAEAGEALVEGVHAAPSEEVMLEPGFYFWQASYSGDANNFASTAPCGAEVEIVTPAITTMLSTGEESDEEIEVLEGTAVTDEATLHGEHAGEATGTVDYSVYADSECTELVAEAGEVSVEGASVPTSSGEELEAGTYYWQAEYSGDENNPAATERCGEEVNVIVTPTMLTTTLSGGGKKGTEIAVEQGTGIHDQASLSGANAVTASGNVQYSIYSDSECKNLVALAEEVEVSEGEVPPSEEFTLPPGTYYWKAVYTGDGLNHLATSACGSEKARVTWPITLSLSSGEERGAEVETVEGAEVFGEATLHGEHAGEATGTVDYSVYADSECTELVAEAGEVSVEGASVPTSSGEELEAGTYYWQAEYSGDENNPAATTTCGIVDEFVINPASDKYGALGDSYSSGEGVRHADGVHPPGSYYLNTEAPWWQQGPGPFMNECHRSEVAWPGLVAKAIYGAVPNVAGEGEVFKQQPPKFIFRACSGATTFNVGGPALPANGGQWDEAILEGGRGWWNGPRPAQVLWLQEPGGLPRPGEGRRANNAIKLVTMTIGGNDAGFGNIVLDCIQWPFELDFLYSPWGCQNTIRREEGFGFAAIENRLPGVLQVIRESAPQARIRIPMYPRVVDWLRPGNIRVGFWGGSLLRLNNTIRGEGGLTAARSIDGFAWRLNKKIERVVNAWQQLHGGDIKMVPATEDALGGHQLGDPQPWINRVVLRHPVESFHPNVCGHRSIALQVLPIIRGGIGAPPASC